MHFSLPALSLSILWHCVFLCRSNSFSFQQSHNQHCLLCLVTQHCQRKSVPFISVAFKFFHVFRDCCVVSTYLMFFCLEPSSAAMGYGVFKKVWRVMAQFFKEDCQFFSFPFTSGFDYILDCSVFCCLCCSCDVYFYIIFFLNIYISALFGSAFM